MAYNVYKRYPACNTRQEAWLALGIRVRLLTCHLHHGGQLSKFPRVHPKMHQRESWKIVSRSGEFLWRIAGPWGTQHEQHEPRRYSSFRITLSHRGVSHVSHRGVSHVTPSCASNDSRYLLAFLRSTVSLVVMRRGEGEYSKQSPRWRVCCR